jgi:hypothetical protein
MTDANLFRQQLLPKVTPAALAPFGVTGAYISRLAKAGRIPAPRLGRNWFVDREAVRTRFNPASPSDGAWHCRNKSNSSTGLTATCCGS